MNATRAATIRLRSSFDGAVSLGRVQTPTLAILARREVEIREFKPEKYWLVDAKFEPQAGREGARLRGPLPRRRQAAPRLRRRGRRDRRRRPGPGRRDHQARDDDEEGARAAPLRPDHAPARGQQPLRLLGPPHARRRAAPLRGAQGAHLPAHELALPLHRHDRRDQADRRGRRLQPRVRQAGRLRDRARRAAARPRDQRRQGHRPPRDHPDALRAPRREDERRRQEGLRHGRAALPRRLPPRRGVGEHAPRDDRRRAHLPHPRARAARAGLALGLRRGRGRQRVALRRGRRGRRPDAAQARARRARRHARGRRRREGDQAAAALLRRVAAGRDGGRRQAARRRRAARADEGLRDRDAGHARRDHRAADRRRLHRARRAARWCAPRRAST